MSVFAGRDSEEWRHLATPAPRSQDGSMKIALFTVVALAACANELVLAVKEKRDAMSIHSAAPESRLESLAHVLKPVLTLLYILILPLAVAALVCALSVFAPTQALVLVLMLLIPATGWLLRR